MEYGASAEDVACVASPLSLFPFVANSSLTPYPLSSSPLSRTCHAHPTVSEAVKEAFLMASSGKAINA